MLFPFVFQNAEVSLVGGGGGRRETDQRHFYMGSDRKLVPSLENFDIRETNMEKKEEAVYCINLNQDSTCFCVGTNQGFKIFSVEPFSLISEQSIPGGVRFAQMLYRTNIVALVGTGQDTSYPTHKVCIYDDLTKKCIGEIKYSQAVLNVQMKRGLIIVLLLESVYMYEYTALQIVNKIETCPNPDAICAFCPNVVRSTFAVPNVSQGHIRIDFLDQINNHSTTLIPAHEGKLACLQFNQQGTILASASKNGTIIRLWVPNTGNLIRELRRGSNPARILSIAFHVHDSFLVCTSDHETLHLWILDSKFEKKKTSLFNLLPKFVPTKYLQSQWSSYQFNVSNGLTRVICTSSPNIIYLVAKQEMQKITFDILQPLQLQECPFEVHSFVNIAK